MATRMQQRRGTAAEWAAQNPVLGPGEIGFETDTKVIKIGDGETAWNDLSLSPLTASGTVMTGPLVVLEPTEPDHAARIGDVVDAVSNGIASVTLDSLPDTDLTGAEEGEAVILGPGGMWIPGPGGGGDASVEIDTYETVGSDVWDAKSPIPTGREQMGQAVVVSGFIYLIGGFAGSVIDPNERYDPVANTWTSRAAMPQGRRQHGVGAVGIYIYTFGGLRNDGAEMSTHERYDTVANTWTSRANMSSVRRLMGVFSHDGFVYSVGGVGSQVNERYDPVANTWSSRANLSAIWYAFGEGVIDEKYYIVSGNRGGMTSVMESYNPVTNTWTAFTSHANKPTVVSDPASAVVAGQLHVVAGFNDGTTYAVNEVYDPVSNTWTTSLADLPTAKRYPKGASVDDVMYIFGGSSGPTETFAYSVLSDPFITLASPAILTSIHESIRLKNSTKNFIDRTIGGNTGDEIRATGAGSLTVVRVGGS